MGNVVKLYYTERSADNKEWELIPSKLLVVENIATYLLTKSSKCTTINDFQYIKNKLELSINVDLAQSYSQPKATTSYKYVSIQNEGELIHYYFVKSAEWRSKTCVRLELVMDVLNTFEEGKDYTFKPNTRIIREHKDRLTKTPLIVNCAIGENIASGGTISVGDTINAYRNESGDFILICTGKVLEIYEESISIQVSSNETYEDIKEQFDRGVQYVDEFQFSKDNANYFECYLDQVVYNFNYVRKIDYINENINPVLQCGSGEGTLLQEKSLLKQDWYLLYRNQNNPSESQATSLVNPVDCLLIPANQTPVNNGVVSNGRITPNTLNGGTYYYVNIYGKTATFPDGTTFSGSSTYRFLVITKQANNKLSVVCYDGYVSDGILAFDSNIKQFDDLDYVAINSFPVPYYSSLTLLNLQTYCSTIYGNETDEFDEDYTGDYIDGISSLDRTDAKNIKLIKLPYCPYDFTLQGGKINLVGTDWYFTTLSQDGGDMNVIKLIDLNVNLTRDLTEDSDINPMNQFIACDNTDITPNKNDLRITSVELESKLYHSEFYSPQLVYDSFAYEFDLEKLDQDWYYDSSNNKLEIKFIMTRTINSKFMFEMKSLKFAMSESNYARFLPIARNNEEVLYNVSYLNYVRSGFNYDIKNKNVALASNVVGLGLSTASIGVSLAMPSVPLKIAGIMASIVSMAMSVKNTIASSINNENSIRQKQDQYKNQATSVVGSDDVDLMSVYASNRLKYLVYEPNPKMKSLLQDLFFYAGYNSGRMGLPNHNTRLNFDYLECEASIECLSSIPEECVQELINALKTGITYLHKTTRTSDMWDFDQKYENWEKSLL